MKREGKLPHEKQWNNKGLLFWVPTVLRAVVFFFFNRCIYSHTHWCTKKQMGQLKITVPVQQDFSTDSVSCMEGNVICEGSKRRREQSKRGGISCVACFLSSNLLP